MRAQWQDVGLLVLAVCAVYANSLTGSFHYDDFHSLVLNPHIRDWHQLANFFTDPGLFSVDPAKAMYRPLLLVSYAFNYAVSGYEVLGYHLFNVLVHLACVLLVWQLALRHGRAGALCAGLIFALHPVASEPVNYISSRSESLAVALLLAGLVCYLRRDRFGAVLGPLAFAAALLVKSIAIVLPGLLLLYEFCRAEQRLEWRRQLSYWGVAVGYMATIVFNRFLGDSLAKAPRGLLSQLLTQCKAVVFYIKLLLVPVGLNVEPQFAAAEIPTAAVVASAALLASGLYVVFRSGNARFYIGWSVLALSPTLLMPLNVLVNEHRLYLPLAGLALGGGMWWQKVDHKKLLWPGLACLLLWGGLTAQRNTDWRDELSLWSAAAKQGPQMPRVHVHLGNALRDGGRLAEARDAYKTALTLEKDNRSARTNLANLYYEAAQADSSQRLDYLQRAIQLYEQVLRRDPEYREALNNLGSAYMILGDYPRAGQVWQRALDLHANHAESHYNMGLLQVRMRQFNKAVPHYQRALALAADAEIYYELGNALASGGRLDEAAVAYRSAVALRPQDATSRYNLAEVLLVMGEQELAQGRNGEALDKWREARRELEQVLSQVPGHDRAQRRLSQLMGRLR